MGRFNWYWGSSAPAHWEFMTSNYGHQGKWFEQYIRRRIHLYGLAWGRLSGGWFIGITTFSDITERGERPIEEAEIEKRLTT